MLLFVNKRKQNKPDLIKTKIKQTKSFFSSCVLNRNKPNNSIILKNKTKQNTCNQNKTKEICLFYFCFCSTLHLKKSRKLYFLGKLCLFSLFLKTFSMKSAIFNRNYWINKPKQTLFWFILVFVLFCFINKPKVKQMHLHNRK